MSQICREKKSPIITTRKKNYKVNLNKKKERTKNFWLKKNYSSFGDSVFTGVNHK